jgi:glycine cleavage system H protein
MDLPENLKYSPSHEWSKLDGDVLTVGITDFAQEQLGDVVFVELPTVGAQVEAGGAVAVVESVKTASDIYAPASGEVLEVNGALEDTPETLNSDPYEGGWMFRLRVADPAELDRLLSADDYQKIAEAGG